MRWMPIVALLLVPAVTWAQEAEAPKSDEQIDQAAQWQERASKLAEDVTKLAEEIRVEIEEALTPVVAWGKEAVEGCKESEWYEQREQMAEAKEWRKHMTCSIEEMKAELEEAPPEVAKAMKKNVELREKMVAALDEKIAAHEAKDWERAEEAEKCLREFERQLPFAEIDLHEAASIVEMRECAKVEGVTAEAVAPLIEELKKAFVRAREIQKQLRALHDEEAMLDRRIALVHKRFELLMLEQETARLQKEIAAE